MNASKNAPVPPAQQPDLTKMVEAAAQEIAQKMANGMRDVWKDTRVAKNPLWDAAIESDKVLHEKSLSAILLRHLQPLAEENAQLRQERDERWNATDCAYVNLIQHLKILIKSIRVSQLRGAPQEVEAKIEEMDDWLNLKHPYVVDLADVVERDAALKAQLTAAQEELARAKQERDALRIEYESRSIWIDKMNKILGYDNSDGFHSEPDPFAIATALQSALAQKEKDGERLKKAQRWILNHCDRWEGDHACATCWPEAQRKHEPIITGFICAVCAARTARAEGDKT